MWSLKKKPSGEFYLTYDRQRWFNPYLRGIWEFIGHQEQEATNKAVEVNRKNGYLCCNDDENGVRVLVCTE